MQRQQATLVRAERPATVGAQLVLIVAVMHVEYHRHRVTGAMVIEHTDDAVDDLLAVPVDRDVQRARVLGALW